MLSLFLLSVESNVLSHSVSQPGMSHMLNLPGVEIVFSAVLCLFFVFVDPSDNRPSATGTHRRFLGLGLRLGGAGPR